MQKQHKNGGYLCICCINQNIVKQHYLLYMKRRDCELVKNNQESELITVDDKKISIVRVWGLYLQKVACSAI